MFREADIVTAEKGEPMRLIDIDAFRKDLGLAERCKECERDARACQYDQIYTRMDFCGWLDDAEIIDAVPVVRCKDCKHRWIDLDEGKRICLLERSRRADDDEWFCADGKRRNE